MFRWLFRRTHQDVDYGNAAGLALLGWFFLTGAWFMLLWVVVPLTRHYYYPTFLRLVFSYVPIVSFFTLAGIVFISRGNRRTRLLLWFAAAATLFAVVEVVSTFSLALIFDR